jgi:hypothetical protein
MIYRGAGCLAVIWFGSSPTPFPLNSRQIISLSQSSCVSLAELTDERAGGGDWSGGAKSSKSQDGEKAWSPINHSLLSDMTDILVRKGQKAGGDCWC